MMAIFTPLRCAGAALIRAVVLCKIEKRPPATRAGDVIGLEDSRSRPPAECCKPAAATDRGPASVKLGPIHITLHENGVADAIAEERSNIGRSRKKSGEKVPRPVRRKRVLQKDRVTRIESGGEQPKCRDHRKADAVSHGHDEVAGLAVHGLDFRVALRINLADPGPFVDQLRLVVAESIDLVSDLLVDVPLHDNANQFLAADADPFHRHRPGWRR